MLVTDIACVLFACVAANHLGLVGAVGELLGKEIPIVSCPKCFTFWSAIAVSLADGLPIVRAAAISFLAAYMAVWLELGMGYIDTKYNRYYDTIYSDATDDTLATDLDEGSADSSVSDVQSK